MDILPARLVAIMTSLRHAIAAFAARESRAQAFTWLGGVAYRPAVAPNRPPSLPAETWTLLWHRLARLANRFQTLFSRWQAGTLPALRNRAPRPCVARATPRLPASQGWVGTRIPEAAPCAGMLHMLLQEPEVPRFVAAVPRAGRLLRPLLRALGLPAPAWLHLPPRPRRAPKKSTEAPAKSPPAPEPLKHDRPLPPYVRAAARAWKKFDK